MSLELPSQPKHLSPKQAKAWQAFRDLLTDLKKADSIYNSLPESQNGKVISTDIARHLDTYYRNTPQGTLRDIEPGDSLAYLYSRNRLKQELLRRNRRKLIRFMAGGWAAGKTHAIENVSKKEHVSQKLPALTWDGTLKDPEWAAEMIDLALDKGWHVEIAYVYRDLELAFYGAMERAASEGRSVPLKKLPSIHRSVQRSICALLILYRATKNVHFLLLHNVGTQSIPIKAFPFQDTELESQGALHYSESHESYYIQAAARFEAAGVERAGKKR